MKTRTGFISNSSSTSYIVSIANETACGKCDCGNKMIVEHISTLFKSNEWTGNNRGMFNGSVKDNLRNLGREAANLKRDIRFGEQQILALSLAIKNHDAIILAGFMVRNIISDNIREPPKGRVATNRREAYDYYTKKQKPLIDHYREVIENEIQYIRKDIVYAKEKLKDLLKKIQTLKSIKGKWIYAFKLGNGTKMKDMMEYFIHNNLVEVIERTDT